MYSYDRNGCPLCTQLCKLGGEMNPVDTWPNFNINITSKRRRDNDFFITSKTNLVCPNFKVCSWGFSGYQVSVDLCNAAKRVKTMAWIYDEPVHWCLSRAGLLLWMGPANERRRYIVTSFLSGWAHTQNDPCMITPTATVFVLTVSFPPFFHKAEKIRWYFHDRPAIGPHILRKTWKTLFKLYIYIW